VDRSRILAYVLAGIPAAIGVAFVARYAYITSDTAIDGAANGFLFGMIAAGAFAGPACAIAVAHNGRKAAAATLGLLAVFAILANWSHTLGAIAHRGAGTEAQGAKAKAEEKDARAELARITAERKAFTPADADQVKAARDAVASAEGIRQRECGNGDPKQRGLNCRQRETEEQAKRDTLAVAIANKAATDRAAQLDTAAALIRAKLANATPVKETNSLGEALGRLLPWLSAATAATFQQGLVSAIAELLIAATLALPELLRRERATVVRREPEPALAVSEPQEAAKPVTEPTKRPRTIAGVTLIEPQKPAAVGSVVEFMLACLPRKRGKDAAVTAVYARYRRWCEEQNPALAALGAPAFAEQFKELCERAGVRTDRRGERVYCVDVALVV
jgi:hypothetical protein